jgi:hypothetical protein
MLIQEAGLAGKVQIGVPVPPDRATTTQYTGTTPPHEVETDALGALLHPFGHSQARGQLIEIGGRISSGRTALAYRIVGGATLRGELTAWVDLPDALDPRSLRRAGVDLQSLLWVRPSRVQAALRATELLLRTGFAVVVVDLEGAARELERGRPAIWSRLLRAVREGRATAVLLGTNRASGSFATLALYTERSRVLFDHGLFEGLECSMTILRNRMGPIDTEYSLHISHRPSPR